MGGAGSSPSSPLAWATVTAPVPEHPSTQAIPILVDTPCLLLGLLTLT